MIKLSPRRCVAATVLGLLTASSLEAQFKRPQWNVPHRGVLFYKRTAKFDAPFHRGFDSGFRGRPGPAVLLQGELDQKHRYLPLPPSSLEDLGMSLAFDLRMAHKKGRFTRTIPRMPPFGRVEVAGSITEVDEKGWQRITATVVRGKLERGVEPKKVFKFHLSQSTTTLKAEIEIERKYDPATGRVVEWKGNLFGSRKRLPMADGNEGPNQEFAFHEHWLFDRVEVNRYPMFRARVAKAIDKGSEWIHKHLANLDTDEFTGKVSADNRTVGTGKLALCLLTLLKANVSQNDPVVKAAIAELRAREVRGAYSLGVSLMAMEALYAPVNERQMFIEGRIKKPLPRKPTPQDLEIMREWTARLLKCTDTRIGNLEYQRRFNYFGGHGRYDNSATQYAVLGLYAAHLCGVKISPTVWFAIASHAIEDQYEMKGVRVPLSLTTHHELERIKVLTKKSGGRSTRTMANSRKVGAWGWPYYGAVGDTVNRFRERQITGSMTTAGITILSICEAALLSAKRGGKLFAALRKGKRRGFAWLLHNFTVRDNPAFHGHHYFYYMYGLERAAELSQVALIGDRDWYFEGATMILERQAENGDFGSGAISNCFCVLFLRQAAPPLPVITGR